MLPGATITAYDWSFGGSGVTTTHRFATAGTYTVVLTVTTIASLIKVRRDPSARAHAGSLRAHRPREQEGSG